MMKFKKNIDLSIPFKICLGLKQTMKQNKILVSFTISEILSSEGLLESLQISLSAHGYYYNLPILIGNPLTTILVFSYILSYLNIFSFL